MSDELTEREYERMLDTFNTAAEWHGGQSSALYSYSSTGKVWGRDHQIWLLAEIDECLAVQVEDDNGALEHLRHTVACWPEEAI